jgi:hypothetical protein
MPDGQRFEAYMGADTRSTGVGSGAPLLGCVEAIISFLLSEEG